MPEYTPSTEIVRRDTGRLITKAEFDRWLAARDREVAAWARADHFRDVAKMVREASIDGWRDACMWHREQGMGVHGSDQQHPYGEEA